MQRNIVPLHHERHSVCKETLFLCNIVRQRQVIICLIIMYDSDERLGGGGWGAQRSYFRRVIG